MVIAVASVCVQLDERAPVSGSRSARSRRRSSAPHEAEAFAADALEWDDPAADARRVRQARRRRGRGRSTTCAARPPTGATSSRCSPRRALGARRLEEPMLIRLTVNGVAARGSTSRRSTSLLALLRDGSASSASKNACEQGECGSCSVWLDGEVVCSCLVPAVQADGRDGADGRVARRTASSTRCRRRSSPPAPSSAASARRAWSSRPSTCSSATPHPTTQAIREALAGNLCRCTGYRKIVDAVRLAAREDAMSVADR